MPATAGDCVEVREHLLKRQPHQLRELLGDAELVWPLFEGGLEDLVAAKQLVGDVPQVGPQKFSGGLGQRMLWDLTGDFAPPKLEVERL